MWPLGVHVGILMDFGWILDPPGDPLGTPGAPKTEKKYENSDFKSRSAKSNEKVVPADPPEPR